MPELRMPKEIERPSFVRVYELETPGSACYAWDVSACERRRLSALLGRDFNECKVAGTYATAPPRPCWNCGKWTELIDWIYTALQREVHTPAFLFHAMKNRLMPVETAHDVYCSGCGVLTHCRSKDKAEGGAPDISSAGSLRHLKKSQNYGVSPIGEDGYGAWRMGGWIYAESYGPLADIFPGDCEDIASDDTRTPFRAKACVN